MRSSMARLGWRGERRVQSRKRGKGPLLSMTTRVLAAMLLGGAARRSAAMDVERREGKEF